MSEVQYPFIDVAVHERVSEAFAAGMAVVLFSPELRSVCWANGRGAALFGFSSVYDFLDQGLDRAELMFRQVEPIARTLKVVGDRRTFTIRIVSGFSRVAVQAHCEMVRFQGRSCILLSAPSGNGTLGLAQRAERLIEGLDDPETHMAVLDGEGGILAASGQFSALDISAQTTRMLVSMVGNDRHRLVKRPISTATGYLPAAVGKISGEPALHLLFVVGLTRPQAAAAEAGETQQAVVDTVSDAAEDGYEEALSAVAAIEDNSDDEEVISFDAQVEDAGALDPAVEESAPADEHVHSAFGEPSDGDDMAPPVAEQAPTMPEDLAADATPGDTRDDQSHDDQTTGMGASETAADATEEEAGADPAALTEVEAGTVDAAEDEPVSSGTGETPTALEPPVEDIRSERPAAARGPRTIRFVWKIDAGGRFSEVSREFAEAVGPHAADISGMAFSDLAALFNLDPDGKIAELLSRRDTWSGKTIWWPVEGTSLVVPVDLAALPTYTRIREFDGFRGFGIVRMGDAAEDPHAAGLSLGPVVAGEERPEHPGQTEVQAGAQDTDEFTLPTGETNIDDEADADGSIAETEFASPGMGSGDGSDSVGHGAEAPTTSDTTPAGADEWPAGERPALKLVANPGQRHSDKVIRLEERRSRLSPGEQAAFQEIARRLDTFAKQAEDAEAEESDATDGPSANDAVAAAEQSPISASGQEIDDMIELPSPAGEDEILAADDADDPAGMTDDDIQAEDEAEPLEAGEPEDIPPHADPYDAMPAGRDRSGLTEEIVDQMPVALLVHAGDRLMHANGEFLRLTGYDSLEALADVGGLDALLQRQELDEKTSDAGGMVVVRADDAIVPVTARLQSVRWNGAAALLLALMPVSPSGVMPEPEQSQDEAADIVPLRPLRTADQLAKLQVEVEELRAILETATDGVVIIGAGGDIRSMNRSASALFNFDSDEIDGKPFVTLFAHESQRAIVDYLGGLSGHGVASVLNDGREVIGREASGGFIPLFMTIGRLTSSNGYCAVIRDITQWKRTEEELRTAKRAAETANAHKSEFLAHVSHEIRTPLNAIIGFADMMASERLGPVGHPRYVEYANDIGRSGRHVLDIVNDLLDISKIEAGELDMDFIAVGLNETVSEAVSLVQPQANSQRVIIRTALSQAVPQVVADLRSIKQIVLNILSNAIRFTPSGGQIVVSTAYEANGSVVLRIRDTGIGMTRAELELAMKPFRQVAGAARNRGDGTGLGLPLTKAMVDANRASFAITSAPNEGTLVEVVFPSQRVLAS